MTPEQQCQTLCDHFGITLDRAVEVLNHNPDKLEWHTVYYWLYYVVNHTEEQYGAADPKAWVKRWRLLYDDDFVKLCVGFLGTHRVDHFTPQRTFIKGIHKESDLYDHIIVKKLYRAAEQWALAKVDGERIKETMSPEEEAALIKDIEEAM